MSMPNIPDINPNINITRDDTINLLLISIAMEEMGLAHITNAGAEEIETVLGTLEGMNAAQNVPIGDLEILDAAVNKILRDAIKKEILLQFKLENVMEVKPLAVLTGITIDIASVSLKIGETQQFTVTGNFSDGTTLDYTLLSDYSSSDSSIATVNTSGLATAESQGTAEITAVAEGLKAIAMIEVKPKAVLESIMIAPSDVTLPLSDKYCSFSAVGVYSDGTLKDISSDLDRSSSDDSVVDMLYQMRWAYLMGIGTAYIVARDPETGVTGTAKVHVLEG